MPRRIFASRRFGRPAANQGAEPLGVRRSRTRAPSGAGRCESANLKGFAQALVERTMIDTFRYKPRRYLAPLGHENVEA